MDEEKILKFWQENKIFEKTLQKPAPRGEFVFYEGPPTANAKPALHHLLARAFKDLIPRYKTMQGFHVRRKAGWDTHGLPVELETEKKLGLKSKKEIEELGIAKFNQKCRESVWQYLKEWEKFTERIGFWLDQKNPYITYEPSYIESLWQIVKKIHERGLLYRDYKVLPWCPRCGTVLSSHELAQGYEEAEDPAVCVKFKVKNPRARGLPANTFLLAWTTTPWTLPGNVALAVGPAIEYMLCQRGNEHLIASQKFASLIPSDPARGGVASHIGKRISTSQLTGLEYEPLYDFSPRNEKSHRVYAADFVSTDEGTGIVHTAVMYGADDFELGQKIGLPKHHLVAEDGTFVAGTPWAGKFVKDADKDIITDLDQRSLIFKKEIITHNYPFCWRCKTPVIYYARDSWFIKMSALREELIKENKKIHWEPEHIREGRFGEWLVEVKDWAVSRERYWGTPLPVWKSADQKQYEVIGSVAELKARSKKSGNRYLVMRHGEADNNIQKVLSSRPEHPHHLTPRGRQEAAQAAAQLKQEGVNLIISSDFPRARETVEILVQALGLSSEQVIYDARLRETNHGDLHLRPIADYHGYYSSLEERFEKRMPNGENFTDIKKRAGEFLYELEKKYSGKNILLVSHEGPIWMLVSVAAGLNVKEAAALRGACEFFFQNAEWRPLDFVPLPHNENFELDLHRPYIDELELVSETGEPLTRVPEVMDVWFDSGAMPFAQDHYPFEKTDLPYPADFISEGIDQTRGWFYTLLSVGVLMARGAPYRNVICLGLVLDQDGKKMSKSLGNVVDPWEMMAKHGADALRFWMYIVNQPGDPKNFVVAQVTEVVNKVFNPLFNTIKFYELYVGDEREKSAASEHVLDRWILARLNQLAQGVTSWLEGYKITEPARALRDFITDLSQWYVRRSRERFKNEKEKKLAGATLRYVLGELAKLLAPFAPFAAEEIYQRTKTAAEPESVHLAAWPETGPVDLQVIELMKQSRNVVSYILSRRQTENIGIRRPLAGVTIGVKLPADYLVLVAEETNVKKINFDASLGDLVSLDIKPTPELVEEGEFRELVRLLQDWRKKQGLKPGEKVVIPVPQDKTALAKKFEPRLKQLVAASEFVFTEK